MARKPQKKGAKRSRAPDGSDTLWLERGEVEAVRAEQREEIAKLRGDPGSAAAVVGLAWGAFSRTRFLTPEHWPQGNEWMARQYLHTLLAMDVWAVEAANADFRCPEAVEAIARRGLRDPMVNGWNGMTSGNAWQVAVRHAINVRSRLVRLGLEARPGGMQLWHRICLPHPDDSFAYLPVDFLKGGTLLPIPNAEERDWFAHPTESERAQLEGALARLHLRVTERGAPAFPRTVEGLSGIGPPRVRPSAGELAAAGGISDDTFRRIREDAGIIVGLRGGAARNRRYTPEEVARLIAAALDGNYQERAKCAREWAPWSSDNAAMKPQ